MAPIDVDGESVSSDSDSLFDQAPINVNLDISDFNIDDSVSLPSVTCTPIPRPEPPLNNTPPPLSEPIADAPPKNSPLPPPPLLEPIAVAPPTNSPPPPPTPTNSGIACQSRADHINITTLISTPPIIPNVTQLSQASMIPTEANSVRGTILQSQLQVLLSFL